VFVWFISWELRIRMTGFIDWFPGTSFIYIRSIIWQVIISFWLRNVYPTIWWWFWIIVGLIIIIILLFFLLFVDIIVWFWNLLLSIVLFRLVVVIFSILMSIYNSKRWSILINTWGDFLWNCVVFIDNFINSFIAGYNK
jgi:hypothetical protein